MLIIFFLIGISLMVALIFLFAFFWSAKSGQYRDTHTPAMRMLWDDTDEKSFSEKIEQNKSGKTAITENKTK